MSLALTRPVACVIVESNVLQRHAVSHAFARGGLLVEAQQTKTPSAVLTYGVLLGGMVLMSFTSPILKMVLDFGLTSFAITFYRIAISTAVLWVLMAIKPNYRAELKSLNKRDLRLMCLGGFFRGANMVLWVMALTYSPVFIVSALLRTNPIWVIVGSYIFLGKSTPLKSLIGVGVCLVGIALCAWGGATDANNNPIGMFLILISAILFGLNFIVTGVIREKFSLWPTMCITFSFATVMLFIACLVSGETMGPYDLSVWAWLFVLSVVFTLLGQSSSVWALKHLNATTVSLVNLLAPFISGLTTFFLRGEVPNLLTIAGAVVMAGGLAVYFRIEAITKAQNAARAAVAAAAPEGMASAASGDA
jgi:drug/metabolite transporter (DMT)-like permease